MIGNCVRIGSCFTRASGSEKSDQSPLLSPADAVRYLQQSGVRFHAFRNRPSDRWVPPPMAAPAELPNRFVRLAISSEISLAFEAEDGLAGGGLAARGPL